MLDATSRSLESYMDVLSARQKLIAGNMANLDTPGYKTRDLDFQGEFQRSLSGGGAPRSVEVEGLLVNNDGNNVNIDREARLLAENTLRFSAATVLLRSRMRVLRAAIEEGKNG